MRAERTVTWGEGGAWAETRALVAAGAPHLATLVHVGRRLDDLPAAPPWRLSSDDVTVLPHLGEALAACPNRYLETRDPATFLGERTAFLACARGRPVGVIVPAVTGASGRIAFLGLVADARGRGLGTALHALALAMLRDRGAAVYLDTTDAENVPMLRIFATNRCRPLAIEHRFGPPV